jgi:carboxyl-terminal processing protease
MKNKKLWFAGAGLCLMASVAATDPGDNLFEIAKNLEIFGTLFKEVNAYYVDEVSPQELMDTGINAMLNALDPYTNYIPEEQIEDYRIMTTGQYGGIGLEVGTRIDPVTKEEKTIAVMPQEGFAAQKAGILIGDQILKIDGVDTRKREDMSNLLKGQAGSTLTLTIKRTGVDKPFDVPLKREKITLYNVPYYGLITSEVGLIQLSDFTSNAGKEVSDALAKLKEQGAKKIILDLRGNPGGLLSEAVNVSNVFVDKGKEIVSTKGKVKEWNKRYQALNAPDDTEIPLIVLTSNTSASAAEIVSGVIQDYDRGVLVGQNTYGKGLVQATRSLSYNSKLKVTVAKYYIPSGRCIQAIDYGHRNPDGSVGKIPDSLRREFKTAGGRRVYDGGGLKPDVEVDKANLAPIARSLVAKGLVFDYATEYRQKNPTIATATKFELNEADYQLFVKWLAGKDYDYTTQVERTVADLEKSAKEEKYFDDIKAQLAGLKDRVSHNKEQDLQKFKAEVKEVLEREIATRYYWAKGSMEATFDDDADILAALVLFKDQARFKKILGQP